MIFNSLGSNYDAAYFSRLNRLLSRPQTWNSPSSSSKLQRHLETLFQSKSAFYYKGRQALTAALLSLNLKPQDQVLTQAFTCYAVEQGIVNAHLKPVFVDTKLNSLNLSVSTLKHALKSSPRAKAVIVQHTLGEVAPIKQIADFCHLHHLYLIEDLAHSFGSVDIDQKPLGYYADAVILSFGRDKIIDAVSGGCLLTKNLALKLPPPLSSPSKTQLFLDLTYPKRATFLRRHSTHPFGKLLHRLLRRTPLLSNPIHSGSPHLQSLPPALADLALYSIQNLTANLQHRRHISSIYTQQLESNSYLQLFSSDSNYLRYPLLVQNRSQLLKFLKQHHIYLSDIWYKSPVEIGSLKSIRSGYPPGSCPHAQHLSSHIINLPTHIHTTPSTAQKIAGLINKFYT